MHELQVTHRILDVVLKHAKAHDAAQVVAIHLNVGELSDLENKWIQKYFDHISKGTMAQDAVLKIERIPVVLKCLKCKHDFNVNIRKLNESQCPECAHKKSIIISGSGYTVKNLEVI